MYEGVAVPDCRLCFRVRRGACMRYKHAVQACGCWLVPALLHAYCSMHVNQLTESAVHIVNVLGCKYNR